VQYFAYFKTCNCNKIPSQNRYFLRFDWSTEVVAIRQMDPVTKFDKWWMSKCMCIEGIQLSVDLNSGPNSA